MITVVSKWHAGTVWTLPPGLLWPSATDWVVWSNRNVCFHSSRGWKFKIKESAGPCSLWGSREEPARPPAASGSGCCPSGHCPSGCSSSVCCHMSSSCASRSSQGISLFLLGYQSYWVRAQPNALVLTWFYLQTSYFQKRSYSQVPGSGPRHAFCVDRIQPVEPSLLNVETLGSVDIF